LDRDCFFAGSIVTLDMGGKCRRALVRAVLHDLEITRTGRLARFGNTKETWHGNFCQGQPERRYRHPACSWSLGLDYRAWTVPADPPYLLRLGIRQLHVRADIQLETRMNVCSCCCMIQNFIPRLSQTLMYSWPIG